MSLLLFFVLPVLPVLMLGVELGVELGLELGSVLGRELDFGLRAVTVHQSVPALLLMLGLGSMMMQAQAQMLRQVPASTRNAADWRCLAGQGL